jgi:hypothetical protein
MDRDAAGAVDEAAPADGVDDMAVVIAREIFGDGPAQLEALSKNQRRH